MLSFICLLILMLITNFQRESIMTTISEHVVCDIVIGCVVVVCKVHVK